MTYVDKSGRVLRFFAVIPALMLVVACNTTPATRSSAPSGSPGSPGSAGSPGVSVGVNPPGMPGIPAPTPAGMPEAPATGAITLPASRSGRPEGAGATAQSGGNTADNTVPGGSQSPADGRPDKTDDEILAEALEELNRGRPGPAQQAEAAESGASLPQTGGGGPAVSEAERKQRLSEELEGGFAKFDRVMRNEQAAIDSRTRQEGSGGFPDAGDPLAEGGDSPAEGEAPGEPLQTAMVDGKPASVRGAGNIATRDHSRVPPDLVNAEGDDIIARQLREAAMKEDDPELREKLWGEYRKYKRDLK